MKWNKKIIKSPLLAASTKEWEECWRGRSMPVNFTRRSFMHCVKQRPKSGYYRQLSTTTAIPPSQTNGFCAWEGLPGIILMAFVPTPLPLETVVNENTERGAFETLTNKDVRGDMLILLFILCVCFPARSSVAVMVVLWYIPHCCLTPRLVVRWQWGTLDQRGRSVCRLMVTRRPGKDS